VKRKISIVAVSAAVFVVLLRARSSSAAEPVDQAVAEPATTLAVCVREKMSGWKVFTPPHAGFWVKVDVNLKPK
jgi:hypothetical protein